MRKQTDLKEELEDLSPLLAKIKKQDGKPFEVPEGYFGSLPDDVLIRLRNTAPEPLAPKASWLDQLVNALHYLLQPRLAAGLVTAVVLVVAGVFWLRPKAQTAAPVDQFELLADLSVDEVSAYVVEHIDVFEEEDLIVAAAKDMPQEAAPTINLDAADVEQYMEDAIQEMDEEDLESLF